MLRRERGGLGLVGALPLGQPGAERKEADLTGRRNMKMKMSFVENLNQNIARHLLPKFVFRAKKSAISLYL